jgi:thiamine pyrophosphokinase
MPVSPKNPHYQTLLRQSFTPEQLRGAALLISGSPTGVSTDLLRTLAQQVGFICAVDSGADQARRANITPDLLVGDLDSIQPETLNAYRSGGGELIAVDPYKDATDLELALDTLQSRGFTAVIATNVLGGRLDHELASLGVLARAQTLSPILIDDATIAIFLSAEAPRKHIALGMLFDAEKSGSPTVSILPLTASATVVAHGFEWPLDNESLHSLDARGVSNLVTSPDAYVELTSSTAAVIIPTSA